MVPGGPECRLGVGSAHSWVPQPGGWRDNYCLPLCVLEHLSPLTRAGQDRRDSRGQTVTEVMRSPKEPILVPSCTCQSDVSQPWVFWYH